MLDAVLKILSRKETIDQTIHLTEDEFFFIKEQLDDAMHIVYAQEKNMVKGNDLKKYKLWQTRFARAKKALQTCSNRLKISKITKYGVKNGRYQVISEPVYCMDANYTEQGRQMITLDMIMQLSGHLNAIVGLSDGERLKQMIGELKEAELIGEDLIEEADLARTQSPPTNTNPYTFEDE
jgi:hypothetical protein